MHTNYSSNIVNNNLFLLNLNINKQMLILSAHVIILCDNVRRNLLLYYLHQNMLLFIVVYKYLIELCKCMELKD